MWKWEDLTCDFVVGLPKSKKNHDAVWVVVDRLTKAAHFIPVRMNMSMEQLVKLYMDNIVRLHGTPVTIVVTTRPIRARTGCHKRMQNRQDGCKNKIKLIIKNYAADKQNKLLKMQIKFIQLK